MIRQGDTGEHVKGAQRVLQALFLYHGAIDGIFGPATKEAVEEFQRSVGLYDDGIIGPLTASQLGLEKFSEGDDSIPLPEKMKIVKVACDVYPIKGKTGYDFTRLREDAAESLTRVRDRLHAAGAILTSAGGLRSLNANVTANRSSKSHHYWGGAHDMDTRIAFRDPATDHST